MTYCAGILVEEGLVVIADTRTNAGLDNVSTFRKLHIFAKPGERVLALATAGNLSVSQSVISLLREGIENPDTKELETIDDAPSLFRAAQLIGRAVRQIRATEEQALEDAGLSFDVSFLFGGQIAGGPMRLYMIYAAGNFIACGQDAPFLQIGEHKYGKPILDRAVTYRSDLYDALKIALISMDFDHALEPRGRAADRHRRDPPGRSRSRAGPSHRGGRALLSRPQGALVGGPARGPYEHPPPALRQRPSWIVNGF